MSIEKKTDIQRVEELIRDAGGRIVGRTRLQKTAYLLTLAGCEDGFYFDYHYYGPYSEDLAAAASTALLLGNIKEEEHPTTWGGSYSVYTTEGGGGAGGDTGSLRHKLIKKAVTADSTALELAATAAYFADKGNPDPWEETKQRKPHKAENGRLQEAKKLYRELREIAPNLPDC